MTRQNVIPFTHQKADDAAHLQQLLHCVDLISLSVLSTDERAAIVHIALRILEEDHKPGIALTSPAATRSYLRLKLSTRENEVFCAVYMDSQHQVLGIEELFQGTIDGASVYPRVVVQQCLAMNAAAIIFAHNHPSGHAEPSDADIRITKRLMQALELIDVRVLDHVVVGTSGSVSLAERGLI